MVAGHDRSGVFFARKLTSEHVKDLMDYWLLGLQWRPPPSPPLIISNGTRNGTADLDVENGGADLEDIDREARQREARTRDQVRRPEPILLPNGTALAAPELAQAVFLESVGNRMRAAVAMAEAEGLGVEGADSDGSAQLPGLVQGLGEGRGWVRPGHGCDWDLSLP